MNTSTALHSYSLDGDLHRGANRTLLTWALMGCLACLCSCSATYKKAPLGGKFEGEPRMVAIAPNTFFFYQPKGKDVLFSYTTAPADQTDRSKMRGRGNYRLKSFKITPESMLTTGASVPRQLWLVPGFSNFDFTRAAIIHDWLYEAHHRWEIARESGNADQMKRYEAYKDITQEDAADIFAECIKATMTCSDSLRQDLAVLEKEAAAPVKVRLEELRTESKNTRSNNWKLNAYHYFVSPDCLVKKSVVMWKAKHDDIGLYELLGGKFAQTAMDRGYLSPWLVERFQAVYRFKQEQIQDLNQAKGADVKAERAGKLRARIYLEVPDRASELAIRSRAKEYANQGFDIKTATVGAGIGARELKVLYYHADDAQQAKDLLNLIISQIPADQAPTSSSTEMLAGQTWARTKHYDVQIGSALASALVR